MRIALRPLKRTTTTCRGGRTFYSDPSFHTSRFESSSATGSSSLPLARTRQWQPFRRYAASATSPITSSDRLDNQPSPSSSTPSPSPVKGAMQIRSRLREIRTLLEEEIGGSEEWTHRLDSAIGDVESQRRGRIGVFGDNLANPRDVVSSLLQDPLVDSDESRRALLSRHVGTQYETLTLSHGSLLAKTPDSLQIPSAWLQAAECQILEINSVETEKETTISHLLSADVICLVLNPFRLLAAPRIAEILPILVAKGRLHFVINGHLPDNTSTDQITDTVLRQLDEIPSDQNRYEASSSNPSISFLRANKALRAWDALAIGLEAGGAISRARTEAFDTFQRQFLRSGVGALQASLLSLARAQTSPQLGTASRTAELALAYIGSTICADRTATSTAAQTVADLRHAADKGGNRARHSSVVHRGISGGTVDGDVQHEMNRARRDLEKSFAGRWGWLSLIGRLRVDDVGSEVSDYLARQFGRNLERQIVFETGELSHLQTELSTQADHTIRQLSVSTRRTGPAAPHPFSSHLLLNHLQTLSLSIPPFEPTSLLDPIQSRRDQIQRFSVPRLQLSAQRTMLLTCSTALLGISASYIAYMPPVASLSLGTAIGLGILCAVGSVAMGQRLWLRAQKRFWKDWTRLTQTLKGDLQTRFSTGVETQVLAKPLAAADGLEKLIAKRDRRLDNLQTRVDGLRSRLYPAQ